MTKTFLRSGSLDAVLALGENGQPVYTSARQLRETLRLRKQHALADCLAIPQVNDDGDRLDWYAPFSGRLKSWRSASDSEKRNAIRLLESHQLSVTALSQQASQAEKPAMKLFGALLNKAFQFPDCQYVYLVDGKPVITFWGFVELDKKSRHDALECLRDTLNEEPPLLVIPAEESKIQPVEPVAVIPVAEAPAAVVAEPAAVVEPVVSPAHNAGRKLRIWWALPPLAIAIAAGLTFWLQPHQIQEKTTKPIAPLIPSDATPVRPPAIVLSSEKLRETLPMNSARVDSSSASAPAPVPEPLTADVAPAVVVPAAKDDLVMTSDAVRVGSIAFLDGRWRVTLQGTKLPTGKPPSLRYNFRRGKGTATILQGDGIRCQAEVTAAMMRSGNLVINSRFTAKCSDGSRYRMPQLVCKQGDGAASCEAQYGDAAFPMTIKRESK